MATLIIPARFTLPAPLVRITRAANVEHVLSEWALLTPNRSRSTIWVALHELSCETQLAISLIVLIPLGAIFPIAETKFSPRTYQAAGQFLANKHVRILAKLAICAGFLVNCRANLFRPDCICPSIILAPNAPSKENTWPDCRVLAIFAGWAECTTSGSWLRKLSTRADRARCYRADTLRGEDIGNSGELGINAQLTRVRCCGSVAKLSNCTACRTIVQGRRAIARSAFTAATLASSACETVVIAEKLITSAIGLVFALRAQTAHFV